MAIEQELNDAHTASIFHRELVESSDRCGCYFCLATFAPGEIHSWADSGVTAQCPRCGIDAVIPSAAGFALTEEFLRQMRGRWFGSTQEVK